MLAAVQNALPARAAVFAAAVADWLSGFTGEVLELKPDLDQVPALAAERDAQWNRISRADFLTEAEKRNLLGLPMLAPEENGDG